MKFEKIGKENLELIERGFLNIEDKRVVRNEGAVIPGQGGGSEIWSKTTVILWKGLEVKEE